MVTWTAENDRKILLAVIAQFSGVIDNVAVAAAIGDNCTERAVVERLKKLKKMSKGDDTVSTPSTPTQTKRHATSSPTKRKRDDRTLESTVKKRVTKRESPGDHEKSSPEPDLFQAP